MVLSRILLGLGLVAALSGCQTNPAEGAAYGEAIYGGCVSCHQPDGSGLPSIGAPSIAGQQQWYVEAQLAKFRDGKRAYHPDDISGLRMRPMARTLPTDTELKSVAAYVSAMKPVQHPTTIEGGNAEAGKGRYGVCSACHGADAGGVAPAAGAAAGPTNGPALKDLPDWYIMAQIQKFKAGHRGTAPGDTTGGQMRAMAGTLPDEQAIKDVIAYINTL